MSDPLYENYNLNNSNNNDDYTAQPEQVAPASEEQAAPVQPESPQQPEKPAYENLYSSTAGYRPYTQPAQETNPYAASYQKTADAVTPPPPQTEKSYSDGFYHQSYRTGTAGNNVNYTRPVNNTASTYPYASRVDTTAQAQPRKREKKPGGLSKGGIALLLVVCILISGAAGFGGSLLASRVNQSQYQSSADSTMVIHKVTTEAETTDSSVLVDKSTSEITSEVADTVVEITTEVMQTSSYYGQYIAQGAGSGVIISEDGYILTNNHVIEDATSIKVTTRSGDSYDAKLIGTDSEVDIALLKIEATDLPVAVFGDSDELEVGDKAVIIGNPLGTLGGSVTEGIISALDRSIDIDGKTMHLMQTDAAINPGNSGGGMFDGQGKLSGIVVAKSSSEEIDNIGFVIPINNVLEILGDLKDYGYVRGRADTGMTFIDLSNSMYAWYYYRNDEAGVYINSVDIGSNAAQAGFQRGDRVVSVDGEKISSSDDITSVISKKSAGDTVTFELNRSGSTVTLQLTLQEKIPDSIQSGNSNSNGNDSYDDGYSERTNPFSFFGR